MSTDLLINLKMQKISRIQLNIKEIRERLAKEEETLQQEYTSLESLLHKQRIEKGIEKTVRLFLISGSRLTTTLRLDEDEDEVRKVKGNEKKGKGKKVIMSFLRSCTTVKRMASDLFEENSSSSTDSVTESVAKMKRLVLDGIEQVRESHQPVTAEKVLELLSGSGSLSEIEMQFLTVERINALIMNS